MVMTVPVTENDSLWKSAESENSPLYAAPGDDDYRRMRVPYTRDNLPTEDNGSVLGRGMDPAVSELREYATRMRSEEDRATAREAYSSLSREASIFLHGDRKAGTAGLYAATGKDALESVARMRDWFTQSTERLGRGLTSGAADQFDKMAFNLRVPLVTGVARHQVHQKFSWEVDSLNKQIEAEHAVAADSFADDKPFEAALSRQADAIRDLAAKTRLTPEAREERIATAASQAATARMDRFIEAGFLENADDALMDRRISLADFKAAESRLETAWGQRQMEEGYKLMQTDPDEVVRLLEDHFRAGREGAGQDGLDREGSALSSSPAKGPSPLEPGSAPDAPKCLRGLTDDQANNLLDAARRGAVLAHANAALDMVRGLPFDEAQSILQHPEARAALELKDGLTDEEAATAAGMLRAEVAQREAAQRRERLNLEKSGLNEVARIGTDPGSNPEQTRELYAGLLRLPDDFTWKHGAMQALENGTMGKQDDPTFTTGIFGTLGKGGMDPDQLQAELLRGIVSGKLTPQNKTQIEGLHQALKEPEGAFYRKGLQEMFMRFSNEPVDAESAVQLLPHNLPDGMTINPETGEITSPPVPDAVRTMEYDPEKIARQRMEAMNYLLPLLDQAKAKGNLAEALDPANPGNIINLAHRLAGGAGDAATVPPALAKKAEATDADAPLDPEKSQRREAADVNALLDSEAAARAEAVDTNAPQNTTHKNDNEELDANARVTPPDWSVPQRKGGSVREFHGTPNGAPHGENNPPEKRYYVVGERPLEVLPFQSGFDLAAKATNNIVAHSHLIRNDGHNIGLTSSGTFSDKPENFDKYTYANDKKYNADLMDKAIAAVNEDWKQEEQKRQGAESFGSSPEGRYHTIQNNCKNFASDVIKKAEEIAKKEGKQLIL